MPTTYILTEYVDHAMAQAEYDKLDDGSFSGRIPACQGVGAFGVTLRQCQDELRSTLEDWMFVGLTLGHFLPVIAGIDLNKEPTRVSMINTCWWPTAAPVACVERVMVGTMRRQNGFWAVSSESARRIGMMPHAMKHGMTCLIRARCVTTVGAHMRIWPMSVHMHSRT
jgi:hypothetical protein